MYTIYLQDMLAQHLQLLQCLCNDMNFSNNDTIISPEGYHMIHLVYVTVLPMMMINDDDDDDDDDYDK